MADYPTHLLGGIIVGIGGGVWAIAEQLISPGFAPVIVITGIAGGIAPDVDHDHSRPARILFNWGAILLTAIILWRLPALRTTTEMAISWFTGLALFIRFPVCWLFKKLTTHRGIFHSIPAMLIFGLSIYLLLGRKFNDFQLQLAGGITGSCGYMMHLLLDEWKSVDFNGVVLRKKRSFGTAFALFKPRKIITLTAYALLFLLGGLVYKDYQGQRPEQLWSLHVDKAPVRFQKRGSPWKR